MSPFSQSVTNSRASPAVFLWPPGIIQMAFVNLGVPKVNKVYNVSCLILFLYVYIVFLYSTLVIMVLKMLYK